MNKQRTQTPAMTVSDVATRLQVPERAVRYRLQRGELAGERGRSGWRIAERDLQTFLLAKANVDSATWRRWLKRG